MDDILILLTSAVLSGLIALIVARYTTRHNHRLERRARAINELTPHLYQLQDLVVMASPGMVSGREFSEAIVAFNAAWKTHRAGLPNGWGFIYREATSAVGEFTGPHVFAAIDRRVWDTPLEKHDWRWQTNAEFYLGHLATCVARSDERRPPRPETYDAWLKDHDVDRCAQ